MISFCRVLPLILSIPHIHTLSHQDTVQIIAIQSGFWFFLQITTKYKCWSSAPQGGGRKGSAHCGHQKACAEGSWWLTAPSHQPSLAKILKWRLRCAHRTPTSILPSFLLFGIGHAYSHFAILWVTKLITLTDVWKGRGRRFTERGEKVGVLLPMPRDAGGCSSRQNYLLGPLTGNVMLRCSCSDTFSLLLRTES